ncbi:MAG: cupin domain-containing protein [Puniceicoccaceae bacterium]
MSKILLGRKKSTPRGQFTSPPREVYVYFGSAENTTFGAGICRIPPGSSNEMHKHDDGDEVIYVIEGEMRIVVDGEEAFLGEGDAVLLLSGQDHQIFNTSNSQDLVHTFTFTPPACGDAIRNGYGRSEDQFKIFPPEEES